MTTFFAALRFTGPGRAAKASAAPGGGSVRVWLLLVVLLMCAAQGCVTMSGNPPPPKIEESRYDDAGIKTSITSQLLKLDASKANDVNVHCFNGHVFLVGEADAAFREQALSIAEKAEGVVHVTPHWFATGTASTTDDAAIEAALDSRSLFSEDINVRRVGVDVWGGNVVVTGIVEKQADIDKAVGKIKEIPQVKTVTSYLVIS